MSRVHQQESEVFHVPSRQVYPSRVGSLSSRDSREAFSSLLTVVLSARSVSYTDSGNCAYLFVYGIVSFV